MRPTLKRELLVSLALLTVAALSVAVATALIAQAFRPRNAVLFLVLLIAADVGVVFLFGRHLITRLVLKPMAALQEAADALAAGELQRRAPAAETQEFTELAERFNRMTERLLDAQSQLVRAEKLASLGHLAAGVAHEIGNPLSAISTYLEVLKKRGAEAEVLDALTTEVGRIDRIVKGLLAYARPREEPAGRVDPATVLSNVLELLERQGVFHDVAVRLELGEPLPAVRIKAHLLEQVVVNLLLNAADAAPGGSVSVGAAAWRYRADRTGERRRGDAESAPEAPRRPVPRPWRPDIADGTPGLLLWVADSGPGVPPEQRERIFEPFYTSKDPGRGTGLGLAIVQRLVHESGGVVWVDDAREGGAAFKVFLPEG